MRADMVEVAGEIGARWTKRLLNICMKPCKVPQDWRTGLIVHIWKRKGDAQDPGKYRGITVQSHIMKLPERSLDKRLRERVEPELGEEQLGFRKGRGTTDAVAYPGFFWLPGTPPPPHSFAESRAVEHQTTWKCSYTTW